MGGVVGCLLSSREEGWEEGECLGDGDGEEGRGR